MADIYIGNIKGPQGETGATGATGPQGDAATVNVGSVSTTAYGNAAQVVNVGTENDAVFNFVIPQGKPGERTTTMSGLTLDTVTTSTDEFPIPAVSENGSTVWGKVIKFFNDVVTALTNKIDTSKIAHDFVTTDQSYVAGADTVKSLNDSLVTVTGPLEFHSSGSTMFEKMDDIRTAMIAKGITQFCGYINGSDYFTAIAIFEPSYNYGIILRIAYAGPAIVKYRYYVGTWTEDTYTP